MITRITFLDFNEDDNYVQKNLESDEEEINYSILLEGKSFLMNFDVIFLLTLFCWQNLLTAGFDNLEI